MQGQPDASADHRAVDPDELQVASEQQLKLGRRLRGVPPLYGPGDEASQLIVELVGKPPRPRLDHALKAFLQARVGAEAPAARKNCLRRMILLHTLTLPFASNVSASRLRQYE